MTRKKRANLKVMISHAGEDKEIAGAWKDLLGYLYENASGVWFSNDPAGAFENYEPFAVEIEENIRNASAILTIQTPNSVHKPWVVWEAGVAKGAKKPIFIVTYNLKKGGLGNPLDGQNQVDGLDREKVEQIAFKIGSLSKQGGFLSGRFSSAWDDYQGRVQQALGTSPANATVQYDKRIILRIPLACTISANDAQSVLAELQVVGVDGSLSIFGYDRSVTDCTWNQFYEYLKGRDLTRRWPGSAVAWADALDDIVHLVLTNQMGDAESLPLYLDESEQLIAYRPSISSRQRNNNFVDIVVVFNQLPKEITRRPPGKCGVLSHLLDFCRMFRWGVLERKRFQQLFDGQLTTREAAHANSEFLRALMNIRIDFQNRGLRKEDILESFPKDERQRISELLAEYYEIIDSVHPRCSPTEAHVAASYRGMLRVNKEFYELVYSAFGSCISKLADQ